MTMNNSG